MEKVTVLMSTYNGELYLEEQIDSILNQKGVLINLLVRDDGSSDNTVSILKKYRDKGLLNFYTGENLNFAGSFMQLLRDAPQSNYYAFSDQDDIWLEDKLSNAIQVLSKLSNPYKLYSSNLIVYRNGKQEGLLRDEKTYTDIYKAMNSSICTGCTMLFNHNLRELVLSHTHDYIHCHDLWFFHISVIFGGFYYDNNAYILYRQHGSNQIGAKYKLIDRIKSKCKSIRTLRYQHYREIEAKRLLKEFEGLIDVKMLKAIKRVAFYKKNLFNRLALLVDNRYHTNFFDKVRIIIGCY